MTDQRNYEMPNVGFQQGTYSPDNNNLQSHAQPASVPVQSTHNVVHQVVPVTSTQQVNVYVSSDGMTQIGCCLAWTVLIINIFFPGIGTMIGSCAIRNPEIRAVYCYSGLCQLLTAPCLIGWCLAQCYSCVFLAASSSGKTFEQIHMEAEMKKKVRGY